MLLLSYCFDCCCWNCDWCLFFWPFPFQIGSVLWTLIRVVLYVDNKHLHWSCANCGRCESHREASLTLGLLCPLLRGERTAGRCMKQIQSLSCLLCSVFQHCFDDDYLKSPFRPGPSSRRPPRWTTSRWTTWRPCGVNTGRWSYGTRTTTRRYVYSGWDAEHIRLTNIQAMLHAEIYTHLREFLDMLIFIISHFYVHVMSPRVMSPSP